MQPSQSYYINFKISKKKMHIYILLALILAIIFLTYFSSIYNAFWLSWEEGPGLFRGLSFKALGLEGIKSIFTHGQYGYYRPLTTLILFIENSIMGPNSIFFHGQSLIIHTINVLLVIYLLFSFGQGLPTIAMVSFIFALHPMQAESICWIPATGTLIYSFFYLLSLIFYVKFKRTHHHFRGNYYLSLLFLVLATLAQVNAVLAFAAFILIDLFYNANVTNSTNVANSTNGANKVNELNKLGRGIIKKHLYITPLAVVSLFLGIAGIIVRMTSSYYLASTSKMSGLDHLLLPLVSPLACIKKFFWPFNLNFNYPLPGFSDTFINISNNSGKAPLLIQNLQNYLGGGIILFLFLLLFLIVSPQVKKLLALGIIFFLIHSLFTVNTIIFSGPQLFSDEFSYLAVLGLSWMLASMLISIMKWGWTAITNINFNGWPFSTYLKEKTTRHLPIVMSILVIFLGIFITSILSQQSYFRSKVWQNKLTIIKDTAQKHPPEMQSFIIKSILYSYNREYSNALKEADHLIARWPTVAEFWSMKGDFLKMTGQLNAAISAYNVALLLVNGMRADLYYNRGVINSLAQNFKQAISDFDQAAQLSPRELILARNIFYYRSLNWLVVKDTKKSCEEYQKLTTIGLVSYPEYESHVNCKITP